MNPLFLNSITHLDQSYIWHPLTQHKTQGNALPIASASGAVITDVHGKQYIDGIASWYTCMYGHCNPYITKCVQEQMNTLDQVVFTGFTHKPAADLAQALIEILPAGQQKIYYSDNGSTSVEVAIKMALQYHANQGRKRSVLLAFEEGFHGDTFGAMSVSGLSVYNGPFEEHFLNVERIAVPSETNTEEIIAQLETLLAADELAAFIYEPLVQGAAGMKMHSATGLDKILAYLRSRDILLIADEVMTGFGKTASYFASDYLQTKPDIVCMSKALTAGLLPMGATSCTQKVFDAFYSDELGKGLFHAHTYTANPLACTAALAGIELLKDKRTWKQIEKIEGLHRQFDEKISALPQVGNCRQLGVIYALDLQNPMERYGELRDRLYQFFMDGGVYLRPLGNTIYILPPFIIEESQLRQIYQRILDALEILDEF